MMLHSINARHNQMGKEGQREMREQPKQAKSKANLQRHGGVSTSMAMLVKRMSHQDMKAANN